MNVYQNVSLAGLHVSNSSVLVGLHINSAKEIKNWQISSNLMFGNLLCVSIGGDFKELFWATVEDKSRMNKENIVIVKPFIEWNDISLAHFLFELYEADKGKLLPSYLHLLQYLNFRLNFM